MAPAREIAGPPLLTGYLLSPNRWYGVTATLTSWAACIVVALPGSQATNDLFLESKDAVARSGVMKLAHESYPQWRRSHSGCPTVTELAEYGGSVKDPWGQDYVILCNEDWKDAGGVEVFSKGEDTRMTTGDDIDSWFTE